MKEFISINKFLKNPDDIYSFGSIFVAKTKYSYLIGPLVHNNFCMKCFYKRLTSSSFFDIKDYHELNSYEVNIITKFFNDKKFNYNQNIIEFSKDLNFLIPNIYNIHFILPIPLCERCYK